MRVRDFKVRASLVAIGLALLAHNPASAAEPHDWNYAVEFYLWGSNIDIESEAGTNSEIRFTDVVNDLELAGMALVAAQRGKWLFGADLMYFDIDDSLKETVQPGVELNDLAIEAWVINPMVGYQVQRSERSFIHLIGGARYLWLDISEKFDLSDPNPPGSIEADQSDGSWDGVIGVRGQWAFSDKWYGVYHADIGSGDSDRTYQLLGAAGYRFERLDAVAGYRYLDWSDTENDALKDLNLSGFFAGVKFFF